MKTFTNLCIAGTLFAIVVLPLFVMTADAISWFINEHPFVAIVLEIVALVGVYALLTHADRKNVAKVRRMQKREHKQAA